MNDETERYRADPQVAMDMAVNGAGDCLEVITMIGHRHPHLLVEQKVHIAELWTAVRALNIAAQKLGEAA